MSNRLPTLQGEVKRAHDHVLLHTAKAAEHALIAGEMLTEAKELCPHGTWITWLAATGISERSAQRYMKLHRAGFESAMVADLGIAKAERYASYGQTLVPEDGVATCFVGRVPDADDQWIFAHEILTYWWQVENGLVRYWSCIIIGESAIYISPRAAIPTWLLGALHDGDPKYFGNVRYDTLPVTEAEQQVAKFEAERSRLAETESAQA